MNNPLDFAVLEVFNIRTLAREKPHEQVGIVSFPERYDLHFWHCLKVKRLSDGVVLVKDFTETKQGKIIYFKVGYGDVKKCVVGTSLGEYYINQIEL
jgi:hypothetical protein